jgi:uncharacterized membrane protein
MRFEDGRGVFPFIGAFGLGAAAMYMLEPARGKRRRHLVTDKIIHSGHVAGDAIGVTGRDLANRARGALAEARKALTEDYADDIVIEERVRSELGRVSSHPGAIEITVDNGLVTLSGDALDHEADRIVEGVHGVRGVTDVVSFLERHKVAGNVPSLQGGSAPAERTFELLQENWTPAARLFAGVAGGALVVYGLSEERRENPLGAALGLAGLALLTRGMTNLPIKRVLGVGAGRRAVEIQKTINIAAPLDEVFDYVTRWENYPMWMSHVREVTSRGTPRAVGERTHWVVDGPAGSTISWNAITTRFLPSRMISWKTADRERIAHAGTIWFTQNDDGSTRVDVHMSYNPIAGAAGHAIAALFGSDPKHQMDDDLARLKTTIETGRAPRDAQIKSDREVETPGRSVPVNTSLPPESVNADVSTR